MAQGQGIPHTPEVLRFQGTPEGLTVAQGKGIPHTPAVLRFQGSPEG